jgi:hypothetical protein
MKRGPVARIRFQTPHGGRPEKQYAALAKLPSDPSEYSFGQWTLCAELWGPPDEDGRAFAWVEFLSPDAPADALEAGRRFTLYDGPRVAGYVEILLSVPKSRVDRDEDILSEVRRPPRMAAAA